MSTKSEHDWDSYKRLILSKLDEQGTALADIQHKVDDISGRLEVLESKLEVRTAMAGSLFGAIAALVLKLLGV
jgi:hypothetical protein